MTVFYTVTSGVLIFITGQIFIKFFLEPIVNLKTQIKETSNILFLHQSEILSPSASNKCNQSLARNALRNNASNLLSTAMSIPAYNFFVGILKIPPIKNIKTASENLMGISNSIYGDTENQGEINGKKAKLILRLLSINSDFLDK